MVGSSLTGTNSLSESYAASSAFFRASSSSAFFRASSSAISRAFSRVQKRCHRNVDFKFNSEKNSLFVFCQLSVRKRYLCNVVTCSCFILFKKLCLFIVSNCVFTVTSLSTTFSSSSAFFFASASAFLRAFSSSAAYPYLIIFHYTIDTRSNRLSTLQLN